MLLWNDKNRLKIRKSSNEMPPDTQVMAHLVKQFITGITNMLYIIFLLLLSSCLEEKNMQRIANCLKATCFRLN